VEPNDADEVATPLPLGGTLRGKVEPEADVDHVRIDVDKPGALQVMLTGVEGQDLVLEVEDAGGTVIARSDRGGVRTKEGIPNLGVTPGRYTLVVRQVPKKKPPARRGRAAPEPAAPPAAVYELSAQLVAPVKGQEIEPDDDRGTANDLIVGDTVTGFVGWNGDADEWKLSVETLSEKNAIDVEVSAVEGVALELEVADALGQPLVTRKGSRNAPLAIRDLLPVVPPGGAPFYYVTVSGAPSNPETTYQLVVKAHVLATDGEIEPDDTPDKPYAFPADRTVVHGTWTPGDVDCYALGTTDQPRTVDVTIEPKGDLDVTAELLIDGKPALDAKGKPVPPVNHAGRGGAEKLSGQVPAGSHAIVRIKGEGAQEGAYDVSVADGE
ncbi:MAG TPA: hypothetical protein VLT45_10035, partial [Kofleriaceae bacterium]|nr:hypothetical protein [Kofleriaceae bacterium]